MPHNSTLQHLHQYIGRIKTTIMCIVSTKVLSIESVSELLLQPNCLFLPNHINNDIFNKFWVGIRCVRVGVGNNSRKFNIYSFTSLAAQCRYTFSAIYPLLCQALFSSSPSYSCATPTLKLWWQARRSSQKSTGQRLSDIPASITQGI